jgi:hypothetical protein
MSTSPLGSDSELIKLLTLNFEHLPVGNAYPEYLVKLIKNSTSESRAHFGVMLLRLRARTASHVWELDQEAFKLVRQQLSHNKKQQPTQLGVIDVSFLADTLTVAGVEPPHSAASRVEGSRTVKGRVEYQVRWKGFPLDVEMTWESEINLAGCADIVADYERRESTASAAKARASAKKQASQVVSKKRKRNS